MKTTHPRYGVHPGVTMVQDWIGTLKSKTGRSLEEWVALGKTKGPGEVVALRAWYQEKHAMGTNSAWWIADRVLGLVDDDEDSPAGYLRKAEEYVDDMYGGGKAGLRPLHDALIDLGLSLGKDVKFCPCATIVPLYRKHVIAQIKPSTRTRIDFGLALGDTKGSGRLVETGGYAKKDRITHKIEITMPSDIDATVRKWLAAAYDRDAP